MNSRIAYLLAAGFLLIFVAWGTLGGGFLRLQARAMPQCSLEKPDTTGWVQLGASASFLAPPSFKMDGHDRWADGNRFIVQAWFGRTGNAKPNMNYACGLAGQVVILEKERKDGQVWLSLEFPDASSGAVQDYVIIAHGMATDEKLLSGILSTVKLKH